MFSRSFARILTSLVFSLSAQVAIAQNFICGPVNCSVVEYDQFQGIAAKSAAFKMVPELSSAEIAFGWMHSMMNLAGHFIPQSGVNVEVEMYTYPDPDTFQNIYQQAYRETLNNHQTVMQEIHGLANTPNNVRRARTHGFITDGFNSISPPVRSSLILDITNLDAMGEGYFYLDNNSANPTVTYTHDRRNTLFHYTNINGLYSILASNRLRNSASGLAGAGQYLTDVDPRNIVARYTHELTGEQISSGLLSHEGFSQAIFGSSSPESMASIGYWIEININDLHVRNVVNHNYIVPNNNPLPLTKGTLVNYGQLRY